MAKTTTIHSVFSKVQGGFCLLFSPYVNGKGILAPRNLVSTPLPSAFPQGRVTLLNFSQGLITAIRVPTQWRLWDSTAQFILHGAGAPEMKVDTCRPGVPGDEGGTPRTQNTLVLQAALGT